MYSVMIIDDDAEWRSILSLKIDELLDFEVVAEGSNGKEAVLLLEYYNPQIVILDIAMPEYDGMRVIRYMKDKCDNIPYIYVITGMSSISIRKMLEDMQVDQYDIKPVDVGAVTQKLLELVQGPKNSLNMNPKSNAIDTMKLIDDALVQLSIPANLMGFLCIKTAIQLSFDDDEFLKNNMIRKVYPDVGKICGLSGVQVERNMRFAILAAKTEKSKLFQELFHTYQNEKISNSLFLLIVSKYIKSLI